MDLSSATLMESSRRGLSNDMAENRPILKKKYVLPPFWFHAQNRYSIPQNVVLFLLCRRVKAAERKDMCSYSLLKGTQSAGAKVLHPRRGNTKITFRQS